MGNTNKQTPIRLVIPNLQNSLKDIDPYHREWTEHFKGYECGIRENGDCYVIVYIKDIVSKIIFDMRWEGVDARIDEIFALKHKREYIPHSNNDTFEIYYDIFHSDHYYLDRDFKSRLLIVRITINDVEISDSEAKVKDILNLITNVCNVCHTLYEPPFCEPFLEQGKHYTEVIVIPNTHHCNNSVLNS